MLRTVFIGSQNEFNHVLVHWLSQRTKLAGVVWTQSTAWQRTWRGRFRFARQRLRRHGAIKVLDEALFYIYYHSFLNDGEEGALRSQVIEPYREEHGSIEWDGAAIFAKNVNAEGVVDFVRLRKPDVVFAMCINDFFGKEIRSIPRHGVMLWHEGITPEYRGLYSPFWAMYNLEFEKVGCTLLKMNDKLDAGDIFVQTPISNLEPHEHYHAFAGHKAIFDSLPAVDAFLMKLERDEAQPIQRPMADDGYYTYPGITDFVAQRIRIRRHLRRAAL